VSASSDGLNQSWHPVIAPDVRHHCSHSWNRTIKACIVNCSSLCGSLLVSKMTTAQKETIASTSQHQMSFVIAQQANTQFASPPPHCSFSLMLPQPQLCLVFSPLSSLLMDPTWMALSMISLTWIEQGGFSKQL
jgi:hypothetical protein